MRSQVQVGICLRPLVDTEIESGAKSVVEIVGNRLQFNNSTAATGHDFEYMFGPGADQIKSVYDTMISPLIDNFFQGFTATVFAYGQTGSGKTYLMGSSAPISMSLNDDYEKESGPSIDETDKYDLNASISSAGVQLIQSTGIIPYSLEDIFRKKSQLQAEGATVQLEMSYLEIYQEDCYDLLSFLTVQVVKESNKENKENNENKENKVNSWKRNHSKEKDATGKILSRIGNLEMRENSKGETVLEGLSSWPVENQSDVNRLLGAAAKARATGKTAMNARSSRSHAIATLSLKVSTINVKILGVSTPGRNASTSTVVTSKLHLVDLAGSERVGKTLATGECLREGVSINRGLLSLGKVVSALNEQQLQSANGVHSNTHVPYRESKLTRLLKDALGGNGMTVMLACCSPADTQFKETVDTLRFAGRASAIVNNAKQNRDETITDLPPFVCYNCGFTNPQKTESEESSVLFEESSPYSSGKGSKRSRDGDILDPPTEHSTEHSAEPSGNSFLLTALEARGKEVLILKRKLMKSEMEKSESLSSLINLQKKYDNVLDELKSKGKLKKKKSFFRKFLDTVKCQTVEVDGGKV